jgi:hypothetical protein
VGVLDAGSHARVGSRSARQGRAIETVDALEEILQRYGRFSQVPAGLRLRHDNGSIFLARLFAWTTQQLAITQEFIPRASPE